MEYLYQEEAGYTQVMKDSSGNSWSYIPFKTFFQAGMDKESIIFGDVTGATAKSVSLDSESSYVNRVKDEKTQALKLSRIKQKLSLIEKVYGYMAVTNPDGKEGFVRIIKKSWVRILIPILVVVLAVALTLGLYFGLKGVSEPNLDKAAIAYQMPGGTKNNDPNSIMLPGYHTLNMNAQTQQVDIALLNPEGNECYFRYHIILKDGGKELYQTGLIKPGTAVVTFKIDDKLNVGSYPIVIKVDAIDLKDTSVVYNGGAIDATLKVE